MIVTRSGYTGEVGFELFTYQDIAVDLWRDARRGGARRSTGPVRPGGARRAAAGDGLPALRSGPVRDLDARSRRACPGRSRWTRARSAAAAALDRQRREGLPSRLRGLRMHERRHIPRAHYPVFVGDRVVGEVTSGTFSPCCRPGSGSRTCGPPMSPGIGDEVEVDIRGRRGDGDRRPDPPFVDRSPR